MKPICNCENCGAEIYKDDTCYRVSDTIFCDLCVEVLTGEDLKEEFEA
ncbi:MAG: hypothetical protein LUE89_07450 [Clostridiales bacterium]|nr:hypothetical protein [Clostridiales bacterium]